MSCDENSTWENSTFFDCVITLFVETQIGLRAEL